MTRVSSEELLAPFSWWESRRLRRTPEALDLRLRLLFGVQWLGFFVLLGGSLLALVKLGPSLATEHPILFPILVLVAIGKHTWELFGLLGGEAHRFHEAPEELRGRVEPEEVEAIAKTVGERFGSDQTPNLYIAIDKQANALSVNSMLLNFIPRYNAIFLNSYLFRALSQDEMLAVLAHELAHFHRYISPLGRNAWLGVVGSIAACTALFAWDPELTTPLLAALVFWWAPLPFLWLFNKVAGMGRHDLEYACDAVAAEVVGAEPMVNALLKIGDRAEIYELVEREMGSYLEKNPKAPSAEVAQALLDRVPEKPVSLAEALRALRSKPLPEGTGGDVKESKRLVQSIRRSHALRKALDVVRWSRFDTICRDRWLDRDELHRYVRALARGEHTATHALATEHPKQEPLQTHPSTRKRIVYLYLHFLAAEGPGRRPPTAFERRAQKESSSDG